MIKQGLKQGYQGFPNSGKGWGSKSPPQWVGESKILLGGTFLPSGENLRSYFENSNIFKAENITL